MLYAPAGVVTLLHPRITKLTLEVSGVSDCLPALLAAENQELVLVKAIKLQLKLSESCAFCDGIFGVAPQFACFYKLVDYLGVRLFLK